MQQLGEWNNTWASHRTFLLLCCIPLGKPFDCAINAEFLINVIGQVILLDKLVLVWYFFSDI